MLLIDFLINRKNYDHLMRGKAKKVNDSIKANRQEEFKYSIYNDIIYDWTHQLSDQLDQIHRNHPKTAYEINLFTWAITRASLSIFRVVVSSDLKRISLKSNVEEHDVKKYGGEIAEEDIKKTFHNKRNGTVGNHIYAFATIILYFGLAAPHNNKKSKTVEQSLKEWKLTL